MKVNRSNLQLKAKRVFQHLTINEAQLYPVYACTNLYPKTCKRKIGKNAFQIKITPMIVVAILIAEITIV